MAYLRFVLALIFVLGLIGLAAWLARRAGFMARATPDRGAGRRLAVVEVASVDAKRRLVLIRRDDTEHLLLLGATHETVIEQGIQGHHKTGTSTAHKTEQRAS